MDLFESKNLFRNMHPDKNLTFSFDDKCIRKCEIVFTDGKPNEINHVENDKVKIFIEDQEAFYVPIDSHRECCDIEFILSKIQNNASIS